VMTTDKRPLNALFCNYDLFQYHKPEKYLCDLKSSTSEYNRELDSF
jgi:hypothetical protein